MPLPVKAPTLSKLWIWLKGAVLGVLFPNDPRMHPVDPSKVRIFTCAGLTRHNYAAYPIFSLHKTDVELIEEYRKAIRKLNIEHREIDLPGPSGPEVGFVVSYFDTMKIWDYLVTEMEDSAIEQMADAWAGCPFSTLLPPGIEIPDECYLPIHHLLERRLTDKVDVKRETTLLLNNITGQMVRITVDFKKKSYHIGGDITGWKNVSIIPDL